MTENVVHIGIGKPPEKTPYSTRVKESVRKAFTLEGAKEAWGERNPKKILQFAEIEASLSPEERDAAMQKLNAEATKGAVIRLTRNYAAAALGLATVAGGVTLVANKDLAQKVEQASFTIPRTDTVIHPGKYVGRGAVVSHDWIKGALENMAVLAAQAKARGEQLMAKAPKPAIEPPVAVVESVESIIPVEVGTPTVDTLKSAGKQIEQARASLDELAKKNKRGRGPDWVDGRKNKSPIGSKIRTGKGRWK